MTGSAGQRRVPTSFLEQLEIPVPSIDEQKRTVTQLNRADQLRRTRRYALQLCDELLPSAFAKELNRLHDCETRELGDFLEFITSGSRGWAEFYAPIGTRFVRSLDVQMNSINKDDVVFVEPPRNAEAVRTRVHEGDVLLTITGSRIGRVAPAPQSLAGAYISQHVAILRLKAGLAPQYLSTYLSLAQFGQREIARLQYGQTKPGLNLEQIRELRLPVPSVASQQVLLHLIDGHMRTRQTYIEALRQADHLFQTFLHQAFQID